MSKKKGVFIGGIVVLAILAAIGFGYRIGTSGNKATAHNTSSMPVSFSNDQQLIVGAGSRIGESPDDTNSALIDSLVLAGYFTKDNQVVARYTEWGNSPSELTSKTAESPLKDLGQGGDTEYIEISSDTIPEKEMQPGVRYFYRTVLIMGGQSYYGPVAVFTSLK